MSNRIVFLSLPLFHSFLFHAVPRLIVDGSTIDETADGHSLKRQNKKKIYKQFPDFTDRSFDRDPKNA